VNWIVLFQDEDKKYDLVNMVTDDRYSKDTQLADYERNV